MDFFINNQKNGLFPYKKKFFRMKMTCFFLIVSLLQITAKGFTQNSLVSIKADDITLEQLFTEIEKQTDVKFLYRYENIAGKKANVNAENAQIAGILDVALSSNNLKYTLMENNLIVVAPESITTLQGITITGTVTDTYGDPLPGVSILIKGTTQGTATDANGNYTLQVSDNNATLVFMYIGFTTQEIPVGNQRTINVSLSENIRQIDEVVVIGYGTQKKVNLTGAISQISAQEMTDRPINNLTKGLQGMIPNLNITYGGGKPGASGSINIRGTTSINGGEPLVLIDGIPGNMDRVNVSDVESVTVLKDASASSIYGARAAFGVILVTTKNAAEGKVQINYRNNFSWTTHANNTDFITSGYWNLKLVDDFRYPYDGSSISGYSEEDYAELWARVNDKKEHPDRPWVVVKPNAAGQDMYRYYGNFDWWNYTYSKWRPKQSHDISFSGATDKTRYLVSGNFTDEKGIFNVNPDIFKRYNIMAKIESDIKPWLTFSNQTRFFNGTYDWYGRRETFGNDEGNGADPYQYAYAAYVPVNPDGTFTGITGLSSSVAPYISRGFHIQQGSGNSKGQDNTSEFNTTFQIVLKPMKGLSITGRYSYNQASNKYFYRNARDYYSKFPGELELYPLAPLNEDRLTERRTHNTYHVEDFFANYETFLGSHHISAMAGFNQELRKFNTISAEGMELLSETLNNLSLVTGERQSSGSASEWATRGAFYRLNYDYAGKYLFETSGRYDGTSRFPQKSRFGFFPSFSIGYRISEENFFAPVKSFVNNLKIRYSYGTLGNQDVSTYAYISTMTTGSSGYLVDGQRPRVTNLPAPVSSSLTWEKSTTNNIGLDVDLLKGRFSLSADIYTRDTKDMLTVGKKLPNVFGASEPRENAADLRTKGFEISMGWKDQFIIANKPFNYSLTAVVSDATAKITKFDNPNGLLGTYRVGQQIGEIWGYKYDGFFKTTEEAQEYAKTVNQDQMNQFRVSSPFPEVRLLQAGDIKILDLDGNGIINSGASTVDDPGDRAIIGNSTTRYPYGLSASANWNGIDFFILFQGIGKKNWYPSAQNPFFWGSYADSWASLIPSNFPDQVWSTENPNAYFPRPIAYIASSQELARPNDMYLQDLAYCKLRNLTIGYKLPSSLFGRIRIEYLRFYLSGENLFTWTKLKTDYIDPEETMWNANARPYPMGKIFSFGLDLTF